MTRTPRARSLERGQVLVEFALSVALVLVVLLAVCDFGRALYTYDLVTSAARIGSRYAIVHGSSCTLSGCPASSAAIQTYVLTKVTDVDKSLFTVITTWSTASGCTDVHHQGPQCIASVKVSYPFKFLLAFNRTITMTSTSQMIISQ